MPSPLLREIQMSNSVAKKSVRFVAMETSGKHNGHLGICGFGVSAHVSVDSKFLHTLVTTADKFMGCKLCEVSHDTSKQLPQTVAVLIATSFNCGYNIRSFAFGK